MKRRFYKELWDIRFKKMLDLEVKSIAVYEGLLAETRGFCRDHSIVPHLEQLIADEKKHAALVRQLLAVNKRQAKTGRRKH